MCEKIVVKAYLDNNILISYEEDSSVLPCCVCIEYRCSYIHILELMESTRDFEHRKDKRFSTISNLTNNVFMTNTDNNCVAEELNSCEKYYSFLCTPLSIAFHYSLNNLSHHWLEGHDPDRLINFFKIDKARINNYKPEELIREHRSFIEKFVSTTDDGIRMASFVSFFNALDMLGFWQDKTEDGALMNRTYDAQHAYFATGCDYFVTNDHRTCMKANVLYQYYGYVTKALSLKEFQNLTNN